jgi:hypothetical protein
MTRDAHGEEVVKFDINLNATIEITKLEWDSFVATSAENGDDVNDALFELGNSIDGLEFPIPDGRVWITAVEEPTIIEGA